MLALLLTVGAGASIASVASIVGGDGDVRIRVRRRALAVLLVTLCGYMVWKAIRG